MAVETFREAQLAELAGSLTREYRVVNSHGEKSGLVPDNLTLELAEKWVEIADERHTAVVPHTLQHRLVSPWEDE